MREALSPQLVSDTLTPLEIKNKEFRRSLFGYSPKEVVFFLDRTAKTWEQVQRHEKSLLQTIENLQKEIEDWKSKEAEIAEIKKAAYADARKITDEAQASAEKYLQEIQTRAEDIRKRTEVWLEKVLAEVENTKQKRSEFIAAFRHTLDQHYALLEQDAEHSFMEENLSSILGTKENQPGPLL